MCDQIFMADPVQQLRVALAAAMRRKTCGGRQVSVKCWCIIVACALAFYGLYYFFSCGCGILASFLLTFSLKVCNKSSSICQKKGFISSVLKATHAQQQHRGHPEDEGVVLVSTTLEAATAAWRRRYTMAFFDIFCPIMIVLILTLTAKIILQFYQIPK